MSKTFWIRRFFTVLTGAFVIITAAQAFKGHDWSYSVGQGAFWGLVTAALFTATRLYWSRRGRHCALCNDMPAAQPKDHRQA